MKKIAYNQCIGEFGLSDKAIQWLIRNEINILEKDGLIKDLGRNSFNPIHLRKHPSLIRVIEALGKEVNDEDSNLKIRELENDTKYIIQVNDFGYEFVLTVEDFEWSD